MTCASCKGEKALDVEASGGARFVDCGACYGTGDPTCYQARLRARLTGMRHDEVQDLFEQVALLLYCGGTCEKQALPAGKQVDPDELREGMYQILEHQHPACVDVCEACGERPMAPRDGGGIGPLCAECLAKQSAAPPIKAGSVVRLTAPNGKPIVGTLESIAACTAWADTFEVNKDGSLVPEYAGETEVNWDGQEQDKDADGQLLYVDEASNVWPENVLTREVVEAPKASATAEPG